VCWDMSRVTSRVISGLFGGRWTASLPGMPHPDKDYVEEGGRANEV